MRWQNYEPKSFYDLNMDSADFALNFREQILHKNPTFFNKSAEMIEKDRAEDKKHNLPDPENERRFEEGEDPILIRKFETDFENKFYRDFYLK